MADDKTFVLYKDLGPKFSKLSREEKGAILEAIFAFENGEDIPEDMPIGAAIAWDFLLPMLISAQEKYDAKSEQSTNAVNARWKKEREKKAAESIRTDTNSYETDTELYGTDTNSYEGDTKEESIKNKDSKEKTFAYANAKKNPRPTLDEVKAYADEKGRPEEAEHFFDFYTANGWKVGKNPMKDWQAAFRNWLKNDFDRGKPKVSEADFYASIAEAERTGFGRI